MSKKALGLGVLILILLVASILAGINFSQLTKKVTTPLLQEASRKITGSVVLDNVNRKIIDINMFTLILGANKLVEVKQEPGSEVYSLTWELDNSGRLVSYKTLGVSCWIPGVQGDVVQTAKDVDKLKEDLKYFSTLFGLNEAMTEKQLNNQTPDGLNMTEGCRKVLGNLKVDPNNSGVINEFFSTGESGSIQKDENGVFDLTNLVTVLDIEEQ